MDFFKDLKKTYTYKKIIKIVKFQKLTNIFLQKVLARIKVV